MAAAKYTIHVPASDELGQPLHLHEAVYHRLGELGAKPVTQHRGHPYHTVTAWAEDTPEWDGMAKQLGTLTGGLANVPSVHVTKEGDKAAAWEMANNQYRPQEGADPLAVAPTSIHTQLTSPTSVDDTIQALYPLRA